MISGEIAELNLLVKGKPSTKLKPRPSAESMKTKNQINSAPSISSLVFPSYKSFEEFRKWIESLKLPICWDMVHINNEKKFLNVLIMYTLYQSMKFMQIKP